MTVQVIGRNAELDAVYTFLDRTTDNATGLLFFGEPGIGKTALWRSAVAAAEAREMRVLACNPAESERALGLGGLTDLLTDIGQSDFAFLPAVQRQALEVALLRGAPGAVAPDQRAVSLATTSLLRALAADAPLLIAVDDVQWLDETSAAVLAYALRRTQSGRIRMLMTMRADSGGALDLLRAIPRDDVERIEVGPLSLAALHQVYVEALGRSFPRLVLVRLEQASGGNPFFALELARALLQSGAPLTPGDQLPVPGNLRDLVAARIEALPGTTREVLLLAAAAERPGVDLLQRARRDAADELEPAFRAGIASAEGGVIRFAHPLFAEAVIAMAGPAQTRRAHAVLATTEISQEARARHLGEAADGPDADAAAALAEAAGIARERGATLEAAWMYERASRLTPLTESDQRVRLAMLAAECLFVDVSEIVQADVILETSLAAAAPGPARALALSLRAIIRYYHGQPREAVRLGEQALAEIGDDPIARATVLGRVSFLVMQVDLERGLSMAEEAVRLLVPAPPHVVPPDVDADLLANVTLLRATAQLGLVRRYNSDEVERARQLISRAGRSWEREGADGISFGIARMTDDLDTAIAMTEEVIRAKSGPAGDDPFNLVQLSGLQVQRGRWKIARANAEAALDAYTREGVDVFPSWGLRGVALVAAHDGRLDEARRLATQGLASAVADENLVLQTFHHHILGFVALSLGEITTADEHLSAAAAVAEASGTRHPGRFKLDGDRLEAVLARGEHDRAISIVENLERAAQLAPTPWTLAISARGRGLVYAAEGDLDEAVAVLDGALREHEALPMPFERARTLLAIGRIHRRRKEKRLADERLSEALTVFDALGAPVWAALATAELARVGLRPRAPTQLTETEQRVADLAATGLSSRQIAELAYLTPKSVGNVLGRVYEKLGIHSRAELGARMADSARVVPEPTTRD